MMKVSFEFSFLSSSFHTLSLCDAKQQLQLVLV